MTEWFNSRLIIAGKTLPFTWKELIFRFTIPTAAILLGTLLVSLLVRRLIRKYIEEGSRRENTLRWSRRILRILASFSILLSAGSLFGAQAWKALGDFFRILNTPFFTSGKTRISVVTLILIIPVIGIASWAGKLVTRGLSSGALKRFGLDAEQSFTIGRLMRYGVMVLVFILGMSMVGIDLSAIGVLFGVLGIGIGFGLQSLIADFFAGVSLIGMGLVKEGDRIQVAGTYDGVIRHIRLMNTELITFENETLIIPNSQLTGGTIHNFSYKDRRVVIVNNVDVSYQSDLDQVIEVMKQIAADNPWLYSPEVPVVRVRAFAESGITMQLRTWVRDVGNGIEAFSWTNLEIWRRFREKGIEIPFPQRVIHQASENPAEAERIRSADGPSISDEVGNRSDGNA